MAENKLADISTDFAVKILNLTDGIKGHYSLANQLERSGTSIGANIREAKYAHSNTFIAPSDYIDGKSDLLFVINLFYHLSNNMNLDVAYTLARKINNETKLYKIYFE